MLLNFRFANHRSFCDEQQLDLMQVYPRDHAGSAESLGSEGKPAESSVPVPIVGIFGANASGKSNVIDALQFMRGFVLESDREVELDFGIARTPFRLVSNELKNPSRYVVDIMIGETRYTYGFTIDDTAVLEEWLFYYRKTERYGKSGRRTTAFARTGNLFEWGPEFKDRPDLQRIAEFTSESALYLSTLSRFRIKRLTREHVDVSRDSDILHGVYLWFRNMQTTVDEFYTRRTLAARIRNQISGDFGGEVLGRLAEILHQADTGIDGIELVVGDPEAKKLLADRSAISNLRRDRDAFRQMQISAMDRVVFRHSGAEDGIMLELADESRGTKQMLSLALDALPVLDVGGVLLVDEIDVSLHPVLSAAVLALFRSPRTNPRNAQVIFTTHDVALLGSMDGVDVLKRDEIWFTEKDSNGCSSLYSLAEFKPRNEGVNRERRYLNGNYGAIPDISVRDLESALIFRGGDK
ncbi:AAA family ATPase [Nocardia sp. IBHARD005]|uniref:AAA family ATPase n=1 Tax=Nocardia sp. IBHARD005 TaxID=3457765 RepID=UPI00405876D6